MSTLSYFELERRQTPRTTIESLTYISFGSNDRGIVLDISEGGLRFRVLSPIRGSHTLHFWFSAEGYRIDAEGEVRWMDEKQVTGGLRFGSLSREARNQIRQWMSGATVALSSTDKSIAPQLSSATKSEMTPVLESLGPTGLRLSKKSVPVFGVFAQGLLAGLFVSALVAAAILLHAERRNFGEVLIEIGQRLTAKSAVRSIPQVSAPFGSSDKPSSPVASNGAKTNRPRLALSEPAVVVSAISPETLLPMIEVPQAPGLISPRVSTNGQPDPVDSLTGATQILKAEPNNDVAERIEEALSATVRPENTSSTSDKYLDLREFRQKTAADKVKETLEQLGVHSSVIRTGHLWMTSYHLLVGPYASDDALESARNVLESRGFQPLSRARRSRRFELPLLTLADADTEVKDCIISWDSNSSAATVTFLKGGNVVLKGQGRWVKRAITYRLDAIVSSAKDRGPLTLLEIQFHGMNQAFVFDASKPIHYFVPPPRANL